LVRVLLGREDILVASLRQGAEGTLGLVVVRV
jgi:hypothetical protein